MIFLHGWGGDVRSFLFVAKNLSVTSTLVDFYGFGKTPHPDYPLTVKDYVDGVIELMDFLKIEKATFVGHSFGGRVAIYIAAKYPKRVDKLVLVDSAGIKPRRGIKYRVKVFAHKILKKFGKGLKGSDDYRVLSPVMKKTFQNVVNYDETHLLKDIKADTAIFWGEKDKDTPLYMAKKLNKKIASSHLFLLTNAGHFSYLDNSGYFLRVISAFIYGNDNSCGDDNNDDTRNCDNARNAETNSGGRV